MADFSRTALAKKGLRPLESIADEPVTTDNRAFDDGMIPPVMSEEEFGLPVDGSTDHDGNAVKRTTLLSICLTIDDWLARDLPPPDRLLGEWLTTTSRVILNAPTGLGKTNFAMAIAAHIAAGIDFMHWQAHRPARVLFVDGEMSRRLLKRRIAECVERLGARPGALFFLSKEDVTSFPPLNTPGGHAAIKEFIQHVGGVDLVVFDNIMSLVVANHRETDGWQQVQPLLAYLTAADIGQLWIHHTGHDTTKGYGDKSREWTADIVIHLTEEKRIDTDVSFIVEFRKARERTPETRSNFATVAVALVHDAWISNSEPGPQAGHVPPLTRKFMDALKNVLAGGDIVVAHGRRSVSIAAWKGECKTLGLLDGAASDKSANSLFNKARRELIAANLIACNGDLTWCLR